MTREEWDAELPLKANPGFPPWGIATWKERRQMLITGLACAVVGGVIGWGILYVAANGSDNIIKSMVDEKRCKQESSNYYDVEKC